MNTFTASANKVLQLLRQLPPRERLRVVAEVLPDLEQALPDSSSVSDFWEGVDVRGESLSCVIIDKLPFASPGDPVMQARIDAIKRSGGQPFMEFQVPQAVIALKQGVGRLIRDVNDSGVVMIGDPRLKQKAYGRIFLNSLPSMPQTSEIKDIETFFSTRVTPRIPAAV